MLDPSPPLSTAATWHRGSKVTAHQPAGRCPEARGFDQARRHCRAAGRAISHRARTARADGGRRAGRSVFNFTGIGGVAEAADARLITCPGRSAVAGQHSPRSPTWMPLTDRQTVVAAAARHSGAGIAGRETVGPHCAGRASNRRDATRPTGWVACPDASVTRIGGSLSPSAGTDECAGTEAASPGTSRGQQVTLFAVSRAVRRVNVSRTGGPARKPRLRPLGLPEDQVRER